MEQDTKELTRIRQGALSELEQQVARLALDVNAKLNDLPPRFTGKLLRDMRDVLEKRAGYYNHLAGRSRSNYIMSDVREKLAGVPYNLVFDSESLKEGLPYGEAQMRNALGRIYQIDDGFDLYNIGSCWSGPFIRIRPAQSAYRSLPESIDMRREDLALVTFREDINDNIYSWQTPQYGGKKHLAKIVLKGQVRDIPSQTAIKRHDSMRKRLPSGILADALGQVWSNQREYLESKLKDRGYIWDSEMSWGMTNLDNEPRKEHPSLSGDYPKNQIISIKGKRYPFYMSSEALRLVIARFRGADLGMEKARWGNSIVWYNVSQLQEVQNKRFNDK